MHVLAAPGRRSGVSLRWLSSTLLVLSLSVWALYALWGDSFNADWTAYEYLFYDGGGWLLDSGRDPGYLLLQDLFRPVLGYEGFRLVVAGYFLAFLLWLLVAWGKRAPAECHFLAFAALLPLLYPRFTVQIREGLAMTLVLAALTLLERPVKKRSWVLPIALMIAASTIHAAVGVFSGLIVLTVMQHRLRLHSSVAMFIGGMVVLAGVGAQIIYSVWSATAETVADTVYSGYTEAATESDVLKATYWIARCFLVWYVAKLVQIYAGRFSPFNAGFLRLSAYVVIPTVQVFSLWLIFGGQSAYIASAASRLLNMLLFVTFALVAFRARKTVTLIGVAALLLVDQQRVMMASLPEI